jgi:Cu+-exporting ATPase
MTIKESTAAATATDPICGMIVDQATARHADREGKTYYFCSHHCQTTFVSTPAGVKPEQKSGGCCG